jgi:hypothetical protein
MKNLNLKLFLSIFFLSGITNAATDYENAQFDNYVSGQGVNEVLEEAQTIICALSRMGTKDLAGDGTYKATIYMNECEQVAAAATDSSQGTTAPSSATSSASSSATSSAATGEAAPEIDTVIVNSGFTTATMQTTKGWLVNDKPYDEQTNREPKSILYLYGEQTAPVSDTNKFGDFVLRYQMATYGNKQEDLPEWYGQCPDPDEESYRWSWCADGAELGKGILMAEGGSIKFKSDIHNSPQQNVVADYFDNGNIAGIYTRATGFMDQSLRDDSCDDVAIDENGDWDHDAWWECQPEDFKNSNVSIIGIFAFGIDATAKSYCTKMQEVFRVDWTQYDEATQGPTLTSYTLTDAAKSYLGNSESWDTNEKCFSIDKADAIRNIWDYGVYNADGSSLKTENQSFPIKTTVEVDEQTRRVHGYASYWGVHVDEEYTNYITDSTEWTRDDWRDLGDTTQEKYTLKVKAIEVDKREKSFISLNSLDGAAFRFWVNDSWWSDQYEKLGFPKVQPWEGKIKFKSSKAVFTDYNNGDASDPLTYGMYGYKGTSNTYVADLVGAKIDKDNIRKIIKNDASDPGKAMNLTMEFEEFPSYRGSQNDWERDGFVRIYLCNQKFNIPTQREIYTWNILGLTSGQCLRVHGRLNLSSDGTKMTLSSSNRSASWGGNDYGAEFYDFDTGTGIQFDKSNWNNSGHEYDFQITLGGIDRPSGMEVKLQSLFSAFGSLSQGDNDGGDIERGLESFLDSSNSFTWIVDTGGINMYDHLDNRYSKVYGSFDVSDTPPATVFVDDIKVTEPDSDNVSSGYAVSLSKAQGSAVTFDYTINGASTAGTDDYSNLQAGTVTIPAGQTSTTIAVNIESDALAEGQDDETIILSLSNPVNAVLGRSSATLYIYDPDTNRVVYDDYYGSFDADTSTFTITEGLKYNPNYVREDLPAPITFTATDWTTHMKKVWNEGEEYERTDYRNLDLYSDELQQDYTITHEAMANPTSATKEAGIVTTKWSRVGLADLPDTLNCIRECLIYSNLNAHYTDVKSQADPTGDATYTGTVSAASPTPYADVGPYIKTSQDITVTYNEGTEDQWSETRSYTRGDWQDGIIEGDVVKYTVTNGVLTDPAGNEIKIGVDWGVSRPGEAIRGARFANPDGWERQTEWGINTGTLVDTSNLQYMECDYSVDENNTKTYDYHPEYTSANGKIDDMRYCAQKMWGNDDILVTYNVNLRLEKNYEIYKAADGSKLELDPPKTLFFRAPNDASKYGSDADKKFRLEYHGDHLGGIPGNVIDIDTGAVLGEWVEQWKDSYRWVQRFQIEDGSTLTDTSGTEYLVKALRGEEWLAKKDSAIGSMADLLTLKTKSDLLTNIDVDWEISQRKDEYRDCNITKTVTETVTYTDSEGNQQTDTYEYEQVDWEACNALEYGTDEYNAAWSIRASFDNCNERLQYDYDQRAEQIARDKARAEEEGSEYTGPQTPYDDPGWMGDAYTNTFYDYNLGEEVTEEVPANRWGHRGQMERCKAIGPLPTSIINGGNASVVNGEIVFDPTPSS